ncbi:MAG: endonuclease/exonuclease/phosphatase family protein [Candidatus Phosphoribacter sp.]
MVTVAVAAITLAGALAALRLTEPQAGRLIELVSFTPGGVAASALGLAGMWGIRRRAIRRAGAAIAATLLAAHVSWAAPLLLGSAPEPDVACTMRVMSQNFEAGDPAALADLATTLAVDVLIVVEASQGALTATRAKVATVLPHAAGVSGSRYAHSVVFSRWPVSGASTSRDGRDTAVTVHSPCLGDVEVLAVHPAPPRSGGNWTRHFQEIERFARERLGPGLATGESRVVVAGDFNATLDHVPLRRLLAFGLRDAAEATNAGWQPTYPAPGSTTWLGLPVPPLVPIDRVLFSGGLAVSHMWRVTTAGADHVGVVADVHPVRAPS